MLPSSYTISATLPVGKSQFFNPFVWWKIFAAAKKQKATHLVLEFPFHGIVGILCKQFLGVQLIVHEHNLEAYRFRDLGNRWWRILFQLEKQVLKQADAIFFKTEKERHLAVKTFGLRKEKTIIVPYGVAAHQMIDRQEAKKIICKRHNISPGTKLLLFAGTLDYGPNAEAVKAMEEKLIPQLNRTGLDYLIVICGRIVFESFAYLKKIRNDHLLFAGNVKDIDTYFAAAAIFLNPVTNGGGVQTKIVDALTYHLNVVCFEEMKDGICGAEDKLFTAPKNDWQAFAAAVNKALGEMHPTPGNFFDCHDWNNIAAKAFNFIRER